nr:tetraspanin-9 [Leptinotarsa decemlineata]XP_023026023.1 tetraspanin-9 [Leptinotarsa decemlineata]XP_023026024.1 tetraspanin-9 [Leptinotarsa decemlineata]XP_023026025.1 tetraspanin-9 [Leptinotarsa decemlineata]XP_023026026.1 tetraspanin-9 [Leptinotarsa decemlineata]
MIDCCAKYILCGFNFFIFLLAFALLGLGTWLAVDKSSFIGLVTIIPNEQLQEFTKPGVIEQISYVFISIGAFMLVVSLLGYCGALRQSNCILTTYASFLLIILILEVVAVSLAVVYKAKAEEEIKNSLKLSISKYYSKSDNEDAITLSWNKIQIALHCCGVDNYTDYQTNEQWLNSDKVIPESCCVLDSNNKPLTPTCTTSPNEVNSFYDKGCFGAFLNWMINHSNLLVAIAIGFLLVELIGIFLSCYLSKSVKRSRIN